MLHVLIIDDQFARDSAERSLLLARTGMVEQCYMDGSVVERATISGPPAGEPIIGAVIVSGQVESKGVIENNYECIAEAVAVGSRVDHWQWNLVLLDVQFDSGVLAAGGIPAGNLGDATFGELAYRTLKSDFPEAPVVLFTTKYQRDLQHLDTPYISKEGFHRRELRAALLCHGKLTPPQRRAVLGLGPGMIAESEVSLNAFTEAFLHAANNVSVVITGESGTGKEVLARYIHSQSPRCGQPFVPINIATIPAGLAEPTLFGADKTAYTGAHRTTDGFFERASGGTLFLDDIDDMPLDIQEKTLRALQEGVITRVGATREIPVDVRVVSAMRRPMAEYLLSGMFRADLWARLNTVVIELPGLQDRPEDIIPMVQGFLTKFSDEFGKKGIGLHPEAEALLLAHPFYQNVRELENLVRRLVSEAGNNSMISAASVQNALTAISLIGRLPARHARQTTIREDAELRGRSNPSLDSLLNVLREARLSLESTDLKCAAPKVRNALQLLEAWVEEWKEGKSLPHSDKV